MLQQQISGEHGGLGELNLPTLEDLRRGPRQVLRFFDPEDHLPGVDCPCRPSLERFSPSLTGYSFVHHAYNLVDPLPCFTQEP